MIRYFMLPDYFTEEAKKNTKKLLDVLSNGKSNLVTGAVEVYVCMIPEDRLELIDYLTLIDTLQCTPESNIKEICPEAVVIGEAMQ